MLLLYPVELQAPMTQPNKKYHSLLALPKAACGPAGPGPLRPANPAD